MANTRIRGLYQYFPDKPSVVALLIERTSQREVEYQMARFASLPPGASVMARLTSLVEGTLAFQRQEGPLMRALLDSLPHLGRYRLLSERTAEVARGLRALLEVHRDEVTAPDLDLDLATHVLVNAIHSLTHDGILPRPADLDDATLGREITRLVLGYLCPGTLTEPARSG